MSIIGTLLRTVTERQAAGRTTAEWIAQLESSGDVVGDRLATAADTPGNREAAAHVIGIERWGQRRLRMALGEPAVRDEYDAYRPSTDESMAALAAEFAEARAATVALAQRAANLPDSVTAPHNDLGDLSVPGWLVYLDIHADRETRRRIR